MPATKKSLLWMLAILALFGCQRAPATLTEAASPPTPTKVAPSPTPAEVATSPTPPPVLKADGGQRRPVVASEVPRITPDELKALLSSARNVLVIDTRGHDAYAAAHIRGALDIPYDQVEAAAPQLSRRAKIVFYCA